MLSIGRRKAKEQQVMSCLITKCDNKTCKKCKSKAVCRTAKVPIAMTIKNGKRTTIYYDTDTKDVDHETWTRMTANADKFYERLTAVLSLWNINYRLKFGENIVIPGITVDNKDVALAIEILDEEWSHLYHTSKK